MVDLRAENELRFTLLPIQYMDVWDNYKKQVACFWTTEEVDLSRDLVDFQNLREDEQHFIKQVLAFFASSDGIISENLVSNFSSEIQIPEVRAAYAFQNACETIHSEMYAILIDTYVKSKEEKDKLFQAIKTIPSIRRKAEWTFRWFQRDIPFTERLVAFACVEGIHFSSSFASIFWLKKRGLMPGLTFSNELISRDEGMHTDLAVLLYKKCDRLDEMKVQAIIRDAVEVELEFVRHSLPVKLIGMNATDMCTYVQFVADRLIQDLGHKKIFNVQNPLDFMDMINLQGKTNFFEKRVSEYSKANVGLSAEDQIFTLDAEF